MNAKKISILALFIALSIIGSFIKIPAIVASVALDIFPALVAAVVIGGNYGFVVALIGHLASAYIGGLPLGPMHLLIAIEMGLIVWLFNLLYKKSKLIAGLFFVVANSLIAPVPFIFILSIQFYISLIPSLFIGSIINLLFAYIFIPRISLIFKNQKLGDSFHD